MARPLRVAFGALDLLAALVVAVSALALPARFVPLDFVAAVLFVLLAGGGIGLLVDRPFGARFARAASALVLAIGLVLIVLLSSAVGFLSGVHGAVGRGGIVVFMLVVALLFPYLVVLPAAQLVALKAEP